MTNYVGINTQLPSGNSHDILAGNSSLPLIQAQLLQIPDDQNIPDSLLRQISQSTQITQALADSLLDNTFSLSIGKTLTLLEIASEHHHIHAAYFCGCIYGNLLGVPVPRQFFNADKSISYLISAALMGHSAAAITLVRALTFEPPQPHFQGSLVRLDSICKTLITAGCADVAFLYGRLLCGLGAGFPTRPIQVNPTRGMDYLKYAFMLASPSDKSEIIKVIKDGYETGLLPKSFCERYLPAANSDQTNPSVLTFSSR